MRNTYAELLLTTVSNSHLWHFYTTSFSMHDALNKFYTSLEDLADKYIESEMGINGPLEPSGEPFTYEGFDASLRNLQALKDMTKDVRAEHEDNGDNGLAAILDEVLMLIDQTFYRLSHLK